MKKVTITKISLVIIFILFYIGTLVILALKGSGMKLWILGFIPFLLGAGLVYLVEERYKQKWQKVVKGEIGFTILLLMMPLINLFILYGVVSGDSVDPEIWDEYKGNVTNEELLEKKSNIKEKLFKFWRELLFPILMILLFLWLFGYAIHNTWNEDCDSDCMEYMESVHEDSYRF